MAVVVHCYGYYTSLMLGQGRDRAMQYLKENPHLANEIEKIIRPMMLGETGQVGSSPSRLLPAQHQDEDFVEEIL
ncbi:hypothetical protein RHSIM_Rhsim06G0237300 [Rhododendron simsii]|uniref:RecA-like C-terminal domain-containing protein n=1 Tax=Rhododendron simsii TaxID=118357 RepID=A0A834LMS4_RHOSS|nr:hypothetical protein RHSIM_Rhsim06G0237300 [Rhododendron simsii]